MIKTTVVLLLLVPAFIFLSSITCHSDGGAGLPDGIFCENPPPPDYDGPLLEGTFIAAYDDTDCSNNTQACRHYNIHIMLKGIKLKQNGLPKSHEKPYAIHRKIKIDPDNPNDPPQNLCDYPPWELKEKYMFDACNLNVADDFGYGSRYYPVLTDVTVTHEDKCYLGPEANQFKQAVIAGTIKYRMTYVPKSDEEN